MAMLNRSMQLFGIPYQFTDICDPRIPEVSNEIGRKYFENIMMHAPIISIIPGSPKYVANDASNTTINALIQAANNDFSFLKELTNSPEGTEFRYYDFQRNYTDYMSYVNILCRACASFLEIGNLTIDKTGDRLKNYDWRNYRTTESTTFDSRDTYNHLVSVLGRGTNFGSGFKYSTYNSSHDENFINAIEDFMTTSNFVQFYIDPALSSSESMSNETSDSKFKGIFDGVSNDMAKELSFITNSASAGSIDEVLNLDPSSITNALNESVNLGETNGVLNSVFSRILSVGPNIIKGENIVMPKIYQSSNYNKQYSFTVHLKAPYGSTLAYYLDVLVPLMHLIALCLPKQTTGNTYKSPFLVKAYVDGMFTVNMGMVQSLEINKNVSETSYNADGLPTEMDVTVTIEDLYSDLMMSPQTDPLLFANNSSLVEYLASTCGLSLTAPQISEKTKLYFNTIFNSVGDIPSTAGSLVKEGFLNKVMSIIPH